MDSAADRERLNGFWAAAGIPVEVRPYLAFQARRYPRIVEMLRPYQPFHGRRILDIGGGVGSLDVILAAAFGGTFELADVAPASPGLDGALRDRGIAAHHVVDLTADHPLAGLPSDYDLLLFVEVLEHLLVNPLLLFREFWGHLRPGGLLFLTTPNLARLGNRLKLVLGRSIKESGRYPLEAGQTYGHVVEYTRSELDQLLAVEGFAPVAARVVQQPPSPRPSRGQRLGGRLLNLELLRRWELGDDILALYRKVERPATSPRILAGRV